MRTKRASVQFLLFLFQLVLVLARCRADRDIVYSARYYYPPGTKRHSHFHLYRVNSDGSAREQITTGNLDDYAPVWSPNGDQIAFMRLRNGYYDPTLCVVGAGGGKVREVLRFGSSREQREYQWSPDSRCMAVLRAPINDQGEEHDQELRIFSRPKFTFSSIRGVKQIAWSPDSRSVYLHFAKGPDRILTVSKKRAIRSRSLIENQARRMPPYVNSIEQESSNAK